MENRYLNEEAFGELVRRIMTGTDRESLDDREALVLILPSFHAYVDAVVRGETDLLLTSQAEGQAYRDKVSGYDGERHTCHENAIINAGVLNRLAERHGVPPVFTGDAGQRHQVASFCMELDGYLFANRRMKLA